MNALCKYECKYAAVTRSSSVHLIAVGACDSFAMNCCPIFSPSILLPSLPFSLPPCYPPLLPLLLFPTLHPSSLTFPPPIPPPPLLPLPLSCPPAPPPSPPPSLSVGCCCGPAIQEVWRVSSKTQPKRLPQC